jgi:iron-sulfur cluster assembly protein
VVVREGLEHLADASEDELDMLERACGAGPGARLACQVRGAGELVVELPQHVVPARAATLPVSMTDCAAQFFAAQLANHPGAVAVRLAVESSGCSGLRYRVDAAQTIGVEDTVFERGGVRVVIDRQSLPYLHGSTLDVLREGLSRRVRFDNPNACQSCGCGESFSV